MSDRSDIEESIEMQESVGTEQVKGVAKLLIEYVKDEVPIEKCRGGTIAGVDGLSAQDNA